MLAVGVDFGLHTHKLSKTFGIDIVFEGAILLDSCNHILVNGSLQL